jgi:hypothetical protein
MKETSQMGETAPKDFPWVKTGFYGSKPADIEEVLTELAEVEEKIK